MSDQKCPKCKGEMDLGSVNDSESSDLKYISDAQKGMFKQAVSVRQGRVCLACGYVEMYVDAEALKKIIKK
jgi:predicted nucleic-acid-binding Zn-ribbon protein